MRKFEKLKLQHIQALSKLYAESFEDVWPVQYFEICIQYGYLGWVCKIDDEYAAFVLITDICDEIEIIKICVSKKFRRQNIALEMLQAVINLQKPVFLEVSVENFSAIALYKKCGFSIISTRKNYYIIDNKPIDAYVMKYEKI